MKTQVAIVGAGLAGLTAAAHLQKNNIDYLLIDQLSSIGGKLQTINKDGYILDKGFQVFLTAYPEALKLLNYQKLNLKYFDPGAIIRLKDKFYTIADPKRSPTKLLSTAINATSEFRDNFKILKLRRKLKKASLDEILKSESVTTIDFLQDFGFSEKIISNFFQPFFTGIFLEKKLETSANIFKFVFKMFSTGLAAIPEGGMNEIPRLISKKINEDKILLNTKVEKIEGNKLKTSGKTIDAEKIILACDAANFYEKAEKQQYNHVHNLYFTLPKAPIRKKKIILVPAEKMRINNMHFVDQINPNCTQKNDSLLSVSIVNDKFDISEDAIKRVKAELVNVFGDEANDWNFLEYFFVQNALPKREKQEYPSYFVENEDIIQCGATATFGSQNETIKSGRMVAEHLIELWK